MIEKNEILQKSHACKNSDFEGGFMHVIHTLYITVQKHLEQTLFNQSEISFSQFLVLAGFACDKEKQLTQAKLANHLLLTEATVSRHVKILVAKKLLTKEADSVNKKIFNLRLTKNGSEVFKETKEIISKEINIIFKNIEEDKEKIIQNFRETITLLHKKN